jgi:flagellar motility protein MotE (MotC chaperone)
MNRTIEIIAMALGGISLLTVCFLGFALMSGIPLHEVGVIGNLFEAPTEENTADGPAPRDPAELRTPRLDDEQLIANQAGLLHSWQLPSPFDAEELGDLTASLKMRQHALDLREAELDGIQARLDEREATLEDRIEGLVLLQEHLDKQRVELDAERIRLDARVREENRREDNKWASQAKLLEDMEVEQRLGILGAGSYEPEEMARILSAMSPETRAETMNGLQDEIKDAALLRSYLEAYGQIAADDIE